MAVLPSWQSIEFSKKINWINLNDAEYLQNLIEAKRFLFTEELADVGSSPAQSFLDLQLSEALLVNLGSEQVENSIYFPFHGHLCSHFH